MASYRVEKATDTDLRFEQELHDLAQPLTSLQCRLEIGLLLGDEASAHEALQESLVELRRVFAAVSRLRAALTARVPEGKAF